MSTWAVVRNVADAPRPERSARRGSDGTGNYPTIQAAITAVVNGSLPNGTLIEVQPGVYNEALLINATSRSLTIRGIGGAGATVVNAGGTGQSAIRIFNATGGIRIEGLTFRGGTGVQGTGGGFAFADASPVLMDVVFENNSGFDSGGGVLSRSNAQFSRCFIRNNSAARFGGGLVITTGSRPVFSNCQIRDNVSGTGGAGVGSIGAGGGVHVNDASPTFRSCLITGNQAKFAAGGIFHMGMFGSPYGPSLLVVEDSEVSNNIVSRYSAADNPGEGGGIHVEDNAVGHLIRTRVLNNTANTSGGLSAYRARFEVISSVIEGNHAQDPQGIGGFGGGIGIHGNNVSMPLRQASSLVLTDSVVRANDARIAAGIQASGDQHCGSPTPNCNPATALRAAVQIIDSLIDGNAAGLYAGGLRLDRADVLIQNSHILRNWVAASGTSSRGRNPHRARGTGHDQRQHDRRERRGQLRRRRVRRRQRRPQHDKFEGLQEYGWQRRRLVRRQQRSAVRDHSVERPGRQQRVPDPRASLLAAPTNHPELSR